MLRIERLYAVAEELRRHSPGTVSASALANKFEVSRRTIERDLASLREIGLPLFSNQGVEGGHGILRQDQKVLFTLSPSEIVGLILAVEASGDSPFSEQAAAATARLHDALPGPARVMADELAAKVVIRADPPSESSVIRQSVDGAITAGRVINIVYTDHEGVTTERAVEAVGLYRGGNHWYLVGWCRLRNDRRLFRLDRIASAHQTTERFEPRDLAATLGWVPGEIAPLTSPPSSRRSSLDHQSREGHRN